MLYRHHSYKKNLCFIIPDTKWYNNYNTLKPNHGLIENIFIDGFENFLFFTTIIIFSKVIFTNNSNKFINTYTNSLIHFSKKFINFNNSYLQISLTGAFISFFLGINHVLGYEHKKK